MREDFTKTTPYPIEEMQALHQQVDSGEKPRSFVEAAQAEKLGRIKSPSGAREL